MESAEWFQLCDWLHNAGAVGFDSSSQTVEPRDFDMAGFEAIRGLAALHDLAAEDVLMSIPLYCAVVAEEIAEPFEGAPWGVRLAAWLLQEEAK
ncbi:hypothetical protein CYMTET_45070, partial [Cymbomonas tetramitiformis]